MSSRLAAATGFNIPGLATLLICLVAWQLFVAGGALQYAYLPAPTTIFAGLVELMASGQLWADLTHTLLAVIIGWTIASCIGVALGVVMGVSPNVRRYFLASIEVLRPMPGIAFVPVALLLFGFSLQTELVVIVFPTLWPVLVNTMGGLANVHPRLYETGRTFRLHRAAIVAKILLPAALPAILVGLRLSLTLALVLAIVAEMVGDPMGLGYAVVRDQQAMRPELMYADVVVIGMLGILLNEALVRFARLCFPDGYRKRDVRVR